MDQSKLTWLLAPSVEVLDGLFEVLVRGLVLGVSILHVCVLWAILRLHNPLVTAVRAQVLFGVLLMEPLWVWSDILIISMLLVVIRRVILV